LDDVGRHVADLLLAQVVSERGHPASALGHLLDRRLEARLALVETRAHRAARPRSLEHVAVAAILVGEDLLAVRGVSLRRAAATTASLGRAAAATLFLLDLGGFVALLLLGAVDLDDPEHRRDEEDGDEGEEAEPVAGKVRLPARDDERDDEAEDDQDERGDAEDDLVPAHGRRIR
jgi:hypothetical protein